MTSSSTTANDIFLLIIPKLIFCSSNSSSDSYIQLPDWDFFLDMHWASLSSHVKFPTLNTHPPTLTPNPFLPQFLMLGKDTHICLNLGVPLARPFPSPLLYLLHQILLVYFQCPTCGSCHHLLPRILRLPSSWPPWFTLATVINLFLQKPQKMFKIWNF